MTKPTFRPRPIDVNKRLLIIRSKADLQSAEDSIAGQSVGGGDEVNEGWWEISQDHGEKMKKIILNIPLPNSVDNAKYSVENKADFKRPASYIHFKVEDPSERLYEIDDEDLQFLSELPPPDRRICTDVKLEDVFDMLERESHRSGSIAPITVAERANIKPSLLATMYDFWTKKRARWGKPLIRRFQPPTQAMDPSPHATFRPREKETKHFRRTRKNDREAFNKLEVVCDDLKQAREILQLLMSRERLKRDRIELASDIIVAQTLEPVDLVNALRLCHDQEMKLKRRDELKKELRRRKDKADKPKESPDLSGAEPEASADSARAHSPLPLSMLSSDPPTANFYKPQSGAMADVRGDLAHRVRMQQQEWFSDIQDNIIPPTATIFSQDKNGRVIGSNQVFSSSSCYFRGRPRIGRGGRLCIDRVASWTAMDSKASDIMLRDVAGLWHEDLSDPSFSHRVQCGSSTGWSWNTLVSRKRLRSAASDDDDDDAADFNDADCDGMHSGEKESSKKSAVGAAGWQGWSRFSFVSAPTACDPLFEPIIAQHKDVQRSSFVLPASASAAVAAGGFGSLWTTPANGASLGV